MASTQLYKTDGTAIYPIVECIDTLSSTDKTKPFSANMGREVNDRLNTFRADFETAIIIDLNNDTISGTDLKLLKTYILGSKRILIKRANTANMYSEVLMFSIDGELGSEIINLYYRDIIDGMKQVEINSSTLSITVIDAN